MNRRFIYKFKILGSSPNNGIPYSFIISNFTCFSYQTGKILSEEAQLHIYVLRPKLTVQAPPEQHYQKQDSRVFTIFKPLQTFFSLAVLVLQSWCPRWSILLPMLQTGCSLGISETSGKTTKMIFSPNRL